MLLIEVQPLLEEQDVTYEVSTRDIKHEVEFKVSKFDELDNARWNFENQVKLVDKLIWEEDPNAVEEEQRCLGI